MASIVSALVDIQSNLKSPKDQKAQRYRYRNIEDINEAVKPLAAKHGCAVVYSDELREINGCLYTVATCTLTNGEDSRSSSGCALMTTDPKNMSVEQSSGSASSYARKYAAQGLFAIDSSENDPDKVQPVRRAARPRQQQQAQQQPQQQVRPRDVLVNACKAYAQRFGIDPREAQFIAKDMLPPNPSDDDYRRVAEQMNAYQPEPLEEF